MLLLNESYAMLIPQNEVVFVGMGARKTVRMRRSSKVTRATLVGAHKMMTMMWYSKRVQWLVVVVVLVYDDSVDW